MKKLSEKMGVGVLVAGLVIGGLGLSGGSVAHADSVSAKEEVKQSEEMEGLGLEEISEEEFEKLFAEMLGEVSIKKEIVDGREVVIGSFK